MVRRGAEHALVDAPGVVEGAGGVALPAERDGLGQRQRRFAVEVFGDRGAPVGRSPAMPRFMVRRRSNTRLLDCRAADFQRSAAAAPETQIR
jgi:hypothetical protein